MPNALDGFTQGPSEIEGQPVDPLIGWCMAYLTNFTGNPSASVPIIMTSGLPMGIQITGRPHGDLDVIEASAAFEKVRPWNAIYDRKNRDRGAAVIRTPIHMATDIS